MVIVSQAENVLVDAANGYVEKKHKSIHAGVRSTYVCLGAYSSEERATEIFKDIITNISSGTKLYNMPMA